MKVLLFDVDGVLVEPLGYRKAVRATCQYFMKQWGWPLPPPDEDTIAFYEIHGITSEWDIVPLYLAALWDAWAARYGAPPADVLSAPRPFPPPPAEPPPTASVVRLARHLSPGDYPASRALQLQQEGRESAPFPHLGAHPLIEALLSQTRDVYRCPVTRVFQQFALGSEAFTATYGLPAEVQTPSFLRHYDRSLLSEEGRARVKEALASGVACAAAYTARPSGPPRGVPHVQNGAPEAEMALEVVGLPDLPLIGYGRLVYFARQRGLPTAEPLLKPAAFHALAAIFAALMQDEQAGLARAARWLLDGDSARAGIPDRLTVAGLDDSVSGLHGVAAAVDVLRRGGIEVVFRPIGVSAYPEKARALRALGAQVVLTVNEGIALILG